MVRGVGESGRIREREPWDAWGAGPEDSLSLRRFLCLGRPVPLILSWYCAAPHKNRVREIQALLAVVETDVPSRETWYVVGILSELYQGCRGDFFKAQEGRGPPKASALRGKNLLKFSRVVAKKLTPDLRESHAQCAVSGKVLTTAALRNGLFQLCRGRSSLELLLESPVLQCRRNLGSLTELNSSA